MTEMIVSPLTGLESFWFSDLQICRTYGASGVAAPRRAYSGALSLVIGNGVFHLFSSIWMSPKLKQFLKSWAINTLAVGLAGLIMHNHIHYQKPVYLLAASL